MTFVLHWLYFSNSLEAHLINSVNAITGENAWLEIK